MNSENGLVQRTVAGATTGHSWRVLFVATAVLASTVFFFLKKGLQVLDPGSSRRRTASPPPGIAQLNNHVWEFKAPVGIPATEIIFFHGLQRDDFEDAFWKTWLSEGEELMIWPKDWLSNSNRLPNARILSVSYNSSAKLRQDQTDMFCLGENLVSDIIQDAKHNIGQLSPVVLVGHSVGGIVMKQFILSAIAKQNELEKNSTYAREHKRFTAFIENLRGVFYYATPNGGSEIADLARQLNRSPILELLRLFDSDRGRINSAFSKYRRNLKVKAFGVAEGIETSYLGFKSKVVVEASARQDIDDFYTHAEADHFTVCKARDTKDPVVIEKLVQFIQKIVVEEDEQKILLHQPLTPAEGRSSGSFERLQSDLGYSVGNPLETVEDFIKKLNKRDVRIHYVSIDWLFSLDEHQKEAVTSELQRAGFVEIFRDSTTINYERVGDAWLPPSM